MNATNSSDQNSSSTSTGSDRHSHGDHDPKVILFIFVSCAIGVFTRRIVHGIKIQLPYTLLLFIMGVLFGLISSHSQAVHEYASIVEMNPHFILHIFLPVLLFESAFAMESHLFVKAFTQVLILAIPGLALSSFLTCLLGRYLFTYNWDWYTAMMFGTILSATDPVAVVSMLKEIGASKQLAMIIEGESLMNDGAAIVFFNVFFKLATSPAGVSGPEMFGDFIRVTVGGPLFGYIMAKITLFWLSRIFNDALAEITITLASTYLTFYIGEKVLGVSGVLAVVVLGVTISAERMCISPEVETFLHRFWDVLAYITNSLIFIIVGVVISEKAILEIHGIDWFYMFALYFGLNVIRGLVIGIFSPLLKHTGYGLTWKEGCVMTWGGLRGAVSLALALFVAEEVSLDQKNVGLKILLHVSGIVFLTLVLNATTVHLLLQILGMSDFSPAKRMAMANAVRYLQDVRRKTLNMLKTDRFLADADWETVERSCEIEDPYKTTNEEAELEETNLEFRTGAVCPECDADLPPQYTLKEQTEMYNEAVLRMLKAEKNNSMPATHALVDWEDNYSTVVKLSCIEDPRKPFHLHQPGDKIFAKCPPFPGKYNGTIANIGEKKELEKTILGKTTSLKRPENDNTKSQQTEDKSVSKKKKMCPSKKIEKKKVKGNTVEKPVGKETTQRMAMLVGFKDILTDSVSSQEILPAEPTENSPPQAGQSQPRIPPEDLQPIPIEQPQTIEKIQLQTSTEMPLPAISEIIRTSNEVMAYDHFNTTGTYKCEMFGEASNFRPEYTQPATYTNLTPSVYQQQQTEINRLQETINQLQEEIQRKDQHIKYLEENKADKTAENDTALCKNKALLVNHLEAALTIIVRSVSSFSRGLETCTPVVQSLNTINNTETTYSRQNTLNTDLASNTNTDHQSADTLDLPLISGNQTGQASTYQPLPDVRLPQISGNQTGQASAYQPLPDVRLLSPQSDKDDAGCLGELVVDPNSPDRYKHILVNKRDLFRAKRNAQKQKNPPLHLLNKIIDMVFTTVELAASRGCGYRTAKGTERPPLDKTKVSAVKDFLISYCGKQGWTVPEDHQLNRRFNMKCTNARHQPPMKGV